MYGCRLYKNYDDVYGLEKIPQELQIKTHYESLDIAKSNRIYYLCFSLPEKLAGKEKENELKQKMKGDAGAD